MVHLTLLSVALFAPLLAGALNDWSKPCFDGKCSYDLHGAVQGEMRIQGSPDAISDITPAGGWWIIGCDPKAEAQDIRLVCVNTDRCGHLNRSIGPAGKLVRLPEKCGKMPFARVVKSWVAKDQNVPAEVSSQLMRRGITSPPQVRGLTLDTDFAAIDPAVTGQVYMFISGATVPGAAGNATITAPSNRPAHRDLVYERGSNPVESAFDRFSSFDKNFLKDLPPIDINQKFPVLNENFQCDISGQGGPQVKGSIQAHLEAKVHAVIQVGVAAEGTIIPPRFDSFGLFAAMDADLAGSLNIVASGSGSFESPTISIFEQGLPGLEFPGILTVGPMFRLEAKASTTVGGKVQANLGVSYKVEDAQLFFPKTDRKRPSGAVSPNSSPLKLSLDPSISAKGQVEAHIIPKIEFGISALKGIARATVDLGVDASASVSLTLDALANTKHTIPAESKPFETPYATLASSSSRRPEPSTSTAVHTSEEPISTPAPRLNVSNVEQRGIGASVHGCVQFDAGIDVGAGAKGKFFGLFEEGKRVSLFQKRFDIYKQCWGAGTSAKAQRALYHVDPPRVPDMRRGTPDKGCYPDLSKLLMLVSQVVPPSNIKPKN